MIQRAEKLAHFFLAGTLDTEKEDIFVEFNHLHRVRGIFSLMWQQNCIFLTYLIMRNLVVDQVCKFSLGQSLRISVFSSVLDKDSFKHFNRLTDSSHGSWNKKLCCFSEEFMLIFYKLNAEMNSISRPGYAEYTFALELNGISQLSYGLLSFFRGYEDIGN